MNLKHSLFTLATALCLSWLIVGCQEEVVTEVEPEVVTEATKKSSLNNARLVDSTLVYDLTVTVSSFRGEFNDAIKEPGTFIDKFTGTLTLTAVDSLLTFTLPVNPVSDNLSTRTAIYSGSYVFTDSEGTTFEREAFVLGDQLLNPRTARLQLFNLPNAGDPRLSFFEIGEDFSDFSEGVNKGTFSIDQQGDQVVLNYTGDFDEPTTSLACGVESVFLPSEERVLVRPGDRFIIFQQLLQTPGLARVEYKHIPASSGGPILTRNISVFVGAATEGDYSVPYQGPESTFFASGEVLATLFDQAGNVLAFEVPTLLLQDGQTIQLPPLQPGRPGPFQFVDSDGLTRRAFQEELFEDSDDLTPLEGTITFNYQAPCDASYDAVIYMSDLRAPFDTLDFVVDENGIFIATEPVNDGAIGVSVNDGPPQSVSFASGNTPVAGSVSRLGKVATPARLALDLREGNNTITLVALDDEPIDLFRMIVNRAPNPETFDHN